MTQLDDGIAALMPALRRYARSLSRSADDADDLLQDSLAAAWSARAGWRGKNLRAWLMTIMTNVYRARFRRPESRQTFADLEAAERLPGPRTADENERLARLAAAIDLLEPDQRAVLMLVVLEGMAYADIAANLDIPLGTVMSRLSRARAALAAILEGANIVNLRKS